MSRYVIHHEDCYGRVVGRIPDGLSRSEYFSHPDRYQVSLSSTAFEPITGKALSVTQQPWHQCGGSHRGNRFAP